MAQSEIFETYRSFFRSLNNSTSFFLTANVTIIGFGANNKSALLILFGGFFPLFILISYYLYSRIFCGIFFAAMHSDSLDEDGKLFLSTNLALASPTLHDELKSIVELDDREKQIEGLQRIKSKFIPPLSHIILVSGVISHVLASITLWYFGNWSFI